MKVSGNNIAFKGEFVIDSKARPIIDKMTSNKTADQLNAFAYGFKAADIIVKEQTPEDVLIKLSFSDKGDKCHLFYAQKNLETGGLKNIIHTLTDSTDRLFKGDGVKSFLFDIINAVKERARLETVLDKYIPKK